jgi:hypothetical protein
MTDKDSARHRSFAGPCRAQGQGRCADAVLFGIAVACPPARQVEARALGSQDLGLRVLVGRRQAIVSSSDRSPKMLAELVSAPSRWRGPCLKTRFGLATTDIA